MQSRFWPRWCGGTRVQAADGTGHQHNRYAAAAMDALSLMGSGRHGGRSGGGGGGGRGDRVLGCRLWQRRRADTFRERNAERLRRRRWRRRRRRATVERVYGDGRGRLDESRRVGVARHCSCRRRPKRGQRRPRLGRPDSCQRSSPNRAERGALVLLFIIIAIIRGLMIKEFLLIIFC